MITAAKPGMLSDLQRRLRIQLLTPRGDSLICVSVPIQLSRCPRLALRQSQGYIYSPTLTPPPSVSRSPMAVLIPNFHGDIVTPSDPTYASAIARWAGNTVRRAKVVTFPKDQDDVTLAIAYATSHNLPLAIRGGAHNPAGAASVEGGLVIDLSRYFNGVRVDPENRRAYVGGGALWDTVDRESIKHGLVTVAGTVSHVGSSCIR